MIDVDVLIIDELGKGRNTDFELTIIDQMIMGRYNQNKILIASTNYLLGAEKKKEKKNYSHVALDQPDPNEESSYNNSAFSPDEFGSLEPRIGKRIMSRLKETTLFVTLEGEDYREVKASKFLSS